MTYGRSLKRHLDHFGLPALINGWAHLEQDRFGWHKLATEPPFAILIGKPFVRHPLHPQKRPLCHLGLSS